MKRKKLRVAAAIVAVALVGAVLFVTNLFTGNPISAAAADRAIDRYVEERYRLLPDLDYKETDAAYNFKLGKYGKYIQSKTSQDTGFWVGYGDGSCTDEYESYVEGRFNTWSRLNLAFSEKMRELVAEQFSYETDTVLGRLGDRETEADMRNRLQLDMELDLHNLPLSSTLAVTILSGEPSRELLSQRLYELAQIMEKNQIQIDYYSVAVRESGNEDEKGGAAIYAYDIPAVDIAGKTAEELIPVIEKQIELWEKEDVKSKRQEATCQYTGQGEKYLRAVSIYGQAGIILNG